MSNEEPPGQENGEDEWDEDFDFDFDEEDV